MTTDSVDPAVVPPFCVQFQMLDVLSDSVDPVVVVPLSPVLRSFAPDTTEHLLYYGPLP